jgi:tRNA dimethylallyltransferase
VEREVIVITGPTASGKTSLSIDVAEQLKTEIISADSRQFYKLLDIGTAKPTTKELKRIKHHFISFLDPSENYNVSKYRRDALRVCEELWAKRKTPVISGGSGLYIKALIDGFAETPDPDPELRDRLHSERLEYGNQYMLDKLKEVDPESTETLIPQNWKRIIRALEVYYITGIPLSEIQKAPPAGKPLNAYQYGILWDRHILYEKINNRTDEMISSGLKEEVDSILKSGYLPDLNSLNTVGYKEMISFIRGEISFHKAVDLIKRNTRRYAKRQITWFRKDARIQWESVKRNEDLVIFAEKIVDRIKTN